ncbi:hypothetical protein Tco_0681268 [Tanacetum coccineum]|uniref:Uncharacterized protein n=1 Tax=Tanacetum coccineum TaxID=301880 RepID=A0ABQ4XN59_9ASTR
MGNHNPICTLRDYSKPSHEGYRNTIELPVGNNVLAIGLNVFPAGSSHNRRDLLLCFLAQFCSTGWTVRNCRNVSKGFRYAGQAIALPQDVLSTSDRSIIELENQVQRLMEAHLALTQPTQVNKVTTQCEICSVLMTLSIAWKIQNMPLLNTHPRVPMKREHPSQSFNKSNLEGLVSDFMASQDARLSKFEADFKQQQSEMTNKIDIMLKAITDQIAGTLPSDTVKNPKLSTYPVLSARSYPTEEPQCSTHVHNPITPSNPSQANQTNP